MANNYLLFSHQLALKSPEAVAWAKERLAGLDQDYPLFEWTLDGDSLIMWSEGSAEVEVVEEILQDYLVRFSLDGYIVFEWAETCSKPRPSEFGGGWCFITATEMVWSHEYLRQLAKEHKEKMNA